MTYEEAKIILREGVIPAGGQVLLKPKALLPKDYEKLQREALKVFYQYWWGERNEV